MSYKDVKDRLYHGHRKIANHTNLTLHQDSDSYPYPEAIKMKLHGNMVAIFTLEFVELFSCGWYTTTTRARLNLALELAGICARVSQHKYQWYLDIILIGTLEFYDGIKITYGGDVIH